VSEKLTSDKLGLRAKALEREPVHRKRAEKKRREKKKWGPFQYFVVVSSVLILAMWGGIIFGGQPAPARTADFVKKPKVLLFLVNVAINRYAHYEGNRYPERLSDLVPGYVSLGKNELFYLDKYSYERHPEAGYYLGLGSHKPGEMTIIFSPQGIVYTSSSSEES